MNRTEIDKARYDRLGPRVAEALNRRNYEAYYVSESADGVRKALSLIPAGASIGWGGSVSLEESGLLKEIKSGNFVLFDRDTAKTADERTEIMRSCLSADFFLTSFNAVSEDGTVINIDGNGNRVAAITFGPKNVIALVGMNKIARSDADALERVRSVAAPRNAERFGLKTTGCAVTGACQDCHAPDCICSVIQTLRFCKIPRRIKVILVGEELGF